MGYEGWVRIRVEIYGRLPSLLPYICRILTIALVLTNWLMGKKQVEECTQTLKAESPSFYVATILIFLVPS